MKEKFSNSFYRGDWQFLTVSFKGSVTMAEGLCDCLRIWEVLANEFKWLFKEHGIRGAVYVEELSVLQFLPCRVLPHVHILADADGLPEELIAQWQNRIDEALYGVDPDLTLESNINVITVVDEEQFERTLGYLIKPIELGTRYRSAWWSHVDGKPEAAVALNSETRDLILGISEITKMRKAVRYLGVMHGTNAEYVGVGKAERNRRRTIRRICPRRASF